MPAPPGHTPRMRAATTSIAVLAAAALLVAVAGAGAGSEDPAAVPAAETGPRHQLLGTWKLGRSGKISMTTRRGRARGRVTRTARLNGCRVPRRVHLFRSLRFVRRDLESDVWAGRIALPDRDRGCRRRSVRVLLRLGSDLRVRGVYRVDGDRRSVRLRRVRPRARRGDPVIATWERSRVGIRVERRDGAFVGVARDAFLLSNNCTVPEGTHVWRLRPVAPGRYDGAVQTFLPPPTCDPGAPSKSRWRLEPGGLLVRESPDGTLTEYTRAAE